MVSNGLDPDQDRHFVDILKLWLQICFKLFAKVISRRQVAASKERFNQHLDPASKVASVQSQAEW